MLRGYYDTLILIPICCSVPYRYNLFIFQNQRLGIYFLLYYLWFLEGKNIFSFKFQTNHASKILIYSLRWFHVPILWNYILKQGEEEMSSAIGIDENFIPLRGQVGRFTNQCHVLWKSKLIIFLLCLLGLLFDPQDGRGTFLRNVGKHIPDYSRNVPEDNTHFS
jgi:hypothetical protein